MKINLHNLVESLRTLLGNVQAHLTDNTKHVSTNERSSWNNKTDDSKIASITELGHIRPDGETITVDPQTGIASAVASAAGLETVPYTGSLNALLTTGFYSCDSAKVTDLPGGGGLTGRPWMVEVSIDPVTGNGKQTVSTTVNPLQVFVRNRTLTGSWGQWSMLVGEPTWITATLSNNWTNNSGNDTLSYFKDSLGFVHMKGIIFHNSPSTAAFTTLPVGYRPTSEKDFAVGDYGDTYRRVKINSAGAVYLATASSIMTVIAVNISFPTN